VPVFIVYGTALAYENNEVHFYDDIYGHDAKGVPLDDHLSGPIAENILGDQACGESARGLSTLAS
jgi:hypothetical protein